MVSRFRIVATRLLSGPLSFPYLILLVILLSLLPYTLVLNVCPPAPRYSSLSKCPLTLCTRSEGIYVESGLELVFILTVLLICYQPLPPM